MFRLFKAELEALRDAYHFVIIDCAPGISAVTEASIRLADLVLVPTIPDFLSTYGLKAFCHTLWRDDDAEAQFRPRRRPAVIATRRRPINEHTRFLERIQSEAESPERPFDLFKTVISESAAVAEGLKPASDGVPFTRKWSQPVVTCFGSLTREVMEALRDPRT